MACAAYLLRILCRRYINSADYMGLCILLDKPQEGLSVCMERSSVLRKPGNLLIGEAKSFLLDTLSDYKNTGYFKYEKRNILLLFLWFEWKICWRHDKLKPLF